MKSAACLYKDLEPVSEYYDRHSKLSKEDYSERLRNTTTLYVGNLSFFTLESQLMEIFSQCGQVVNLIIGLNKQKMQPCGFCFVEYATRQEASFAVDLLNRSLVDGRPIRVDWDYGFEPQRQFGRGKMGGQVRDEMRKD
jgi:RNA recognition motif-containing protein